MTRSAPRTRHLEHAATALLVIQSSVFGQIAGEHCQSRPEEALSAAPEGRGEREYSLLLRYPGRRFACPGLLSFAPPGLTSSDRRMTNLKGGPLEQILPVTHESLIASRLCPCQEGAPVCGRTVAIKPSRSRMTDQSMRIVFMLWPNDPIFRAVKAACYAFAAGQPINAVRFSFGINACGYRGCIDRKRQMQASQGKPC
jgi:hypothetical protein